MTIADCRIVVAAVACWLGLSASAAEYRIVVDLGAKTVTATNTMSVREQVPVRIVNLGGSAASSLDFRLINRTGGVMAICNSWTGSGSNECTGILDLNTVPMVADFSNKTALSVNSYAAAIWDQVAGVLLANDVLVVQNNPYNPTSVPPASITNLLAFLPIGYTNEIFGIGAGATNLARAIGAGGTSLAYAVGAGASNLALGVGAGATNLATGVGAGATSLTLAAWATASNALAATGGGSNLAYAIGAGATSLAYAVGAGATGIAYAVGAGATSLVAAALVSTNIQSGSDGGVTVTNYGKNVFLGVASRYATNDAWLPSVAGASNLARAVGAGATSFAYAVGAGATNYGLTIGAGATSEARRVGAGATNLSLAVGLGATNYGLAIGAGASNLAYAIGAGASNLAGSSITGAYVSGVSGTTGSVTKSGRQLVFVMPDVASVSNLAMSLAAAGSNQALAVGAGATSLAVSVGAGATNYGLAIGAGATNVARAVGAGATSLTLAAWATASNALTISGAATNLALSVGAGATSLTLAAWATASNAYNGLAGKLATNGVKVGGLGGIVVTNADGIIYLSATNSGGGSGSGADTNSVGLIATNVVNGSSNVAARLASNVWSVADSVTNYASRTGGNVLLGSNVISGLSISTNTSGTVKVNLIDGNGQDTLSIFAGGFRSSGPSQGGVGGALTLRGTNTSGDFSLSTPKGSGIISATANLTLSAGSGFISLSGANATNVGSIITTGLLQTAGSEQLYAPLYVGAVNVVTSNGNPNSGAINSMPTYFDVRAWADPVIRHYINTTNMDEFPRYASEFWNYANLSSNFPSEFGVGIRFGPHSATSAVYFASIETRSSGTNDLDGRLSIQLTSSSLGSTTARREVAYWDSARNMVVSGRVTATSFVGDGSLLTGVSGGAASPTNVFLPFWLGPVRNSTNVNMGGVRGYLDTDTATNDIAPFFFVSTTSNTVQDGYARAMVRWPVSQATSVEARVWHQTRTNFPLSIRFADGTNVYETALQPAGTANALVAVQIPTVGTMLTNLVADQMVQLRILAAHASTSNVPEGRGIVEGLWIRR